MSTVDIDKALERILTSNNGGSYWDTATAISEIRTHLKAELLAKMPKLHECDKTCNINSREWIAGHQGYRDAEKNTITEITKIVNEL